MKMTTFSVCDATGIISYRDKIAAILAMAACRHARNGTRQECRPNHSPFCQNGI